jgi:hypothetical protein
MDLPIKLKLIALPHSMFEFIVAVKSRRVHGCLFLSAILGAIITAGGWPGTGSTRKSGTTAGTSDADQDSGMGHGRGLHDGSGHEVSRRRSPGGRQSRIVQAASRTPEHDKSSAHYTRKRPSESLRKWLGPGDAGLRPCGCSGDFKGRGIFNPEALRAERRP